jgi:glycosidase
MPDLNIASSRVRDEISKVVGYWLSWAFPASGSTLPRS